MTEKSIAVLNIRLPASLKWQIAISAAENRRSMNSEIIYRLEAMLASEAPAEERAA